MPKMLEGTQTMSEGDVDFITIDTTPFLDSTEVCNGTPTGTEVDGVTDDDAVSGGDLTLDNGVVNTATLVVDGQTVAIGKAVQVRIQGQQQGSTYVAKISFTTDSSRTVGRGVTIECV